MSGIAYLPERPVVTMAEARRRLAETQPDEAKRGWCGAQECTGSCEPTPQSRAAAHNRTFSACPVCAKVSTAGQICLACSSMVRSGELAVEYR